MSCVKPGSVSPAERHPPPIVSAASKTTTLRPVCAMTMAAASPLGPDPTTTASGVIRPAMMICRTRRVRLFHYLHRQHRLRRRGRGWCRTVGIHERLEFRMEDIQPELVALHLLKCPIGSPAVSRHPIDSRHDTGTMTPSLAMHVDGLVRRIG